MSDQHFDYLNSKNLPVGFWIKKADNLLTKGINEILETFGIKRIELQTINLISEKERVDKQAVIDLLKPFADAIAVIDILQKFVDNKLVELVAGEYTLSPSGKQLCESCHQKQAAFRKKAAKNISQEDYESTIRSLKQLVTNLTED